MRLAFLMTFPLLLVGCAVAPPSTTTEKSEGPHLEFPPRDGLGDVLAILDQLPRADEPPNSAAMSIVLAAGVSPQVHDGLLLLVWHDGERDEVWVQQSGGYPGVDIWFGPGPDTLLPIRRPVRQLVIADQRPHHAP